MKSFITGTFLLSLSMSCLVGTSLTYMLVPEALDSLVWLGQVVTGFVVDILAGHSDLQRMAVPVPGAIWLLAGGMRFLGWAGPT